MSVQRTGRLGFVIAVFAAVFLFACGGQGEAPEQPSAASIAAPSPRPTPRPAPSGPPVVVIPPPAPAPEGETLPVPVEPPVGTGPAESAESMESLLDEEPAPEEPAPEPPLDPTGRVFTNKDLGKYKDVMEQFGFREDTVVVDLSAQPQSGTTVVSSKPSRDEMTEEAREKEILEVQSEMHRISAELDYLKKRIPSLQNPFMPRSEISEADQSAEAGLDNAERLAHVKQRILENESRLSELNTRYAELYKSHADRE